ncbi:MAG: hypothetical protein WCQ65_11895 [Fermentimonas sp.]|jgi:hypothetical protein|nr:hypothetical protein [Acholeplasmataceae bacterium]MDY3202605.1 hypothetical protein [Methanocorpusculum sp.]
MKKTTILPIILGIIPLIVFNLIFFLVGGIEHLSSVWISYGFIHFSYVMLLIIPLLITKGKSAAVFGFTLYSITVLYFIIEFITGMVFVLLALDEITVPLIIQIILAGIYLIILLTNIIANENTNDTEVHRTNEIEYVKTASSDLSSIIDEVHDAALKKKIEELYDLMSSSSVKSHSSVYVIESNIMSNISELEKHVVGGNIASAETCISSIKKLISERNHQLR